MEHNPERTRIMTDTTFTTTREAIAYITDIIEDATGIADARTEYDIDAIADAVIGYHADQTPEGTTIASSVYFAIDADEDAFYDTIFDNKLVGITA